MDRANHHCDDAASAWRRMGGALPFRLRFSRTTHAVCERRLVAPHVGRCGNSSEISFADSDVASCGLARHSQWFSRIRISSLLWDREKARELQMAVTLSDVWSAAACSFRAC